MGAAAFLSERTDRRAEKRLDNGIDTRRDLAHLQHRGYRSTGKAADRRNVFIGAEQRASVSLSRCAAVARRSVVVLPLARVAVCVHAAAARCGLPYPDLTWPELRESTGRQPDYYVSSSMGTVGVCAVRACGSQPLPQPQPLFNSLCTRKARMLISAPNLLNQLMTGRQEFALSSTI